MKALPDHSILQTNSNSKSLTGCFADVCAPESLQDKRLKAPRVLPPAQAPRQQHFHVLHTAASKEMLHARCHGSAHIPKLAPDFTSTRCAHNLPTHTTESLWSHGCQVCHRCQAAGIHSLALFYKPPLTGKNLQ